MLTPEEQAVLNRTKSPELPNLKRPQRPGQSQPGEQSADHATDLAALTQYRQQSDSALAADIQACQQTAIASVQRLQASAEQFATEVAHQQALTIASVPALVNAKTRQYLREFQALETESQQGFATPESFSNWAERLSTLVFAPSEISGILPTAKT